MDLNQGPACSPHSCCCSCQCSSGDGDGDDDGDGNGDDKCCSFGDADAYGKLRPAVLKAGTVANIALQDPLT